MKMIQSFNTAIQSLMVRLFTQMPTRSNRQRGASALEYLVLAAVIVLAIGAAAYIFAGDTDNPVTGAFNKLTDCLGGGDKC